MIVKPKIYNKKYHKKFKKIFTWNDDLADGKLYIKLNLSHHIPNKINKSISQKEKLCTIISTNRVSSIKNELYSERVKAIRWFEEHQPSEFDLYGIGWNEYYFSQTNPLRIFNRIYYSRKILHQILGENYPSYKGKVKSKEDTLNRYKFSICYENVMNIPGYITEKIFDAFIAGCVPIYLGANNIDDYIPCECYIDKRKYESYEELYAYMSTLSKNSYLEYLDNIENYLNSSMADQFRDSNYANIIYKAVVNN